MRRAAVVKFPLAVPRFVRRLIKTKTMLPFVLVLVAVGTRYMLRSEQVRRCNLMGGLSTVDGLST
jgi:hypothetical protein